MSHLTFYSAIKPCYGVHKSDCAHIKLQQFSHLIWKWFSSQLFSRPFQSVRIFSCIKISQHHLSTLIFYEAELEHNWTIFEDFHQCSEIFRKVLSCFSPEKITLYLSTHLTPMSQEMSLSLRALPPHRHPHEDKKGSWAWGVFSQKGVSVAAHLRDIRPDPTSKKDTLMLRKNSNTNTINRTLNYLLLDYVSNTYPSQMYINIVVCILYATIY